MHAANCQHQELSFTHTGKPFVIMSQKTWSPDTKDPMHIEHGYLHCKFDGTVTMNACDPTGVFVFEIVGWRAQGLHTRIPYARHLTCFLLDILKGWRTLTKATLSAKTTGRWRWFSRVPQWAWCRGPSECVDVALYRSPSIRVFARLS